MQVLFLTSPITFITSDCPGRSLLLSMMAKPAFNRLPMALALSTPPTSGATQTTFLVPIFFNICFNRTGAAYKLSTGISKKP